MPERVPLVGPHAPEWEDGGSRPSKTNCTTEARGPEKGESTFEDLTPDEWWQRKNEIVDRFVEERPGRAARPISVRGGTKLRDEAAQEKFTGEEDEERYWSKTWSSVLNEFLDWYNGYRDVELVYASPEGEEVRSDMENSHMPQYGDRYYARIKAFERQIVTEYEDPHSVMLTFSGSSENANGGWRCPADHLRDVIESWRPERGRGVYHVLRDVLEVADANGSTVHLLNVADTAQDSVVHVRGDVIDVLENEGEEIVAQAAERARERRIDTVTEVLQGDPYRTIVDYASTRDIDLIAMPTHGRRGLERFLLGSTTERVIRQSDLPVLTIRPSDDRRIGHPYRDVLVATDGSSPAMEALSLGIDVSRSEGAVLHLLSAITYLTLGADVRTDIHRAELEASANQILSEAAEIAADAGVESVSETVEWGPSIHEAILTYIDENDVGLVVGTHGRTGFDRYMLGSVTEYLVRTSPIPLLTVRPPEEGT